MGLDKTPAQTFFITRRLFTFVALAILVPRASTASPLFPSPIFTVGIAPSSVAVADFDGDGNLDLAIANFDSDDVSILQGTGTGALTEQLRFKVGDGALSIAFGDFNDDGRLDLVTANFNSDDISILFGMGNGLFSTQKKLPAGDGPTSVAVADLNRDGVGDVVVANWNSSDITVFFGRADGFLQLEARLSTGLQPGFVTIADVNNDGVSDVLVANRGSFSTPGDLSIFLGTTSGGLAPERRVFLGFISAPKSIASADFNQDGFPDLAVASGFSRGDVLILLGAGDGTFTFYEILPAGLDPVSAAVGDFNSDGLKDLAVANLNSGFISIHLGLGDGSFESPREFVLRSFPRDLKMGDFNADGLQDLVVVNDTALFKASDVSIALGTGDGGFIRAERFSAGDGPASVAVNDLNGDGKPDLAVANSGANLSRGDISILEGIGNGAFKAQIRIGVGSNPHSVVSGDFNGDGIADLGVANSGSSDVSILLGLGDFSFAPQRRIMTGDFPRAITVGDFNGDGAMDLAVANADFLHDRGDVLVLLGFGDGNFGAGERIDVGVEPSHIAVGDLNADNIEDLVVVNVGRDSTSGEITVLLGRGDGTFETHGRLTPAALPRSAALGDFNGDGRPDIAVVNGGTVETPGRVSIYLNLGAGNLSSPKQFEAGPASQGISAGDFNADRILDLAVANPGGFDSGDVSILLGFGDGTFGRPVRFATGLQPPALAVGDFNGDSRPDLVTANYASRDLSVLLNLSTFPTHLPTAKVQAQPFIECSSPTGSETHLDGQMSSDEDSAPGTNTDIFSFRWFEIFGTQSPVPLAVGINVTVKLAPGSHRIILQVTDRDGFTDSDQVLVTVRDTTPPELICGSPATVECTAPNGSLVSLAAEARDLCSRSIFVTNDRTNGGHDATDSYPLGRTGVTFTAVDEWGNVASCTSSVTVADTKAPALLVIATPQTLWPPNHRLVDIEALAGAEDACGAAVTTLAEVTSNEQDNAPGDGDGNTINDIQGAQIGTADFAFGLRAERSGSGGGRVYIVTYEAVDASGNRTLASSPVLVPHDRGGVTDPVQVSAQEISDGTTISWNDVSDARFYSLVRGNVKNVHELPETISLGDVTCLEARSLDLNSAGDEDYENPPPGEAFFYVVSYNDGGTSSYGTAAVAKPKTVESGDCE